MTLSLIKIHLIWLISHFKYDKNVKTISIIGYNMIRKYLDLSYLLEF